MPSVKDFSPHLFWDINKDKLDFNLNKSQVIAQVLQYGLLKDWLLIKDYYGLKVITETAVNLRQLDPQSISFIAALSGISKESFKCYSTKPLTPQHWNF